jgi:GT2 family glycosyltransferase
VTEPAMSPAFTVVIICLNEAEYIEDCLQSLEASALAGRTLLEILIVDGASQDSTVELAECWGERHCLSTSLSVLRLDHTGYARQRNAGVAAATTSWIVFLSADVRVPENWARETRRVLTADANLAIGQFVLVPTCGKGSWMAPLARTVYPSVSDSPSVERSSTVHLAATRTLLGEHPFDDELDACEDKDFAYRATTTGPCNVVALPVKVEHLARETFVDFMRKIFIESRELRVIVRKHGRTFPDCFGWQAHLRRTGLVVVLAVVAVMGGHVLARRGDYAAWVMTPTVLAVGGHHRGGWAKGPARGHVILAVPHALAMWAVVLGGATGVLQGASPFMRTYLRRKSSLDAEIYGIR